MLAGHLASQSDMRLEAMDNGATELKWCIFTKGMRAPIAKIIVDTRQTKLTAPGKNPEPTAHIVNVFVRPEFRGKRLGEHLVRLAQCSMWENGFEWMTLEAEENVEHHGKLVGLYERCGFEIYPQSEKFPLEYNGDECFRKVPMRCRLSELVPTLGREHENMDRLNGAQGASSSSEATSTIVATSTSNSQPQSSFATVQFVDELRREAVQLLRVASLNVDLVGAVDFIDQHLAPGTMESAFRTGNFIRSLGHPDWMELAGYLRHIGRIQEKWSDWHTPYMVQVGGTTLRHRDVEEESKSDSDDDDEQGSMPVKSGPMPVELCDETQIPMFIDPERYSQGGLDEAVLTWTPMEYSYLALTFGDRCSAPHEMAQVLRYSQCLSWLRSEEFNYLESWGDADLKQLTIQFKHCIDHSERSPLLNAKQIEEARARFLELVDKYVSDVRMM